MPYISVSFTLPGHLQPNLSGYMLYVAFLELEIWIFCDFVTLTSYRRFWRENFMHILLRMHHPDLGCIIIKMSERGHHVTE